jgi:hypothetical protein
MAKIEEFQIETKNKDLRAIIACLIILGGLIPYTALQWRDLQSWKTKAHVLAAEKKLWLEESSRQKKEIVYLNQLVFSRDNWEKFVKKKPQWSDNLNKEK